MRGRFPVGAWNPRSGPRHPSTIREERPDHDLADPANGAKVPRCRTCGRPDLRGNRLLDFDLYLGGKRAGRYTICEGCYLAANDPPLADPLDVQTA